MRGMFNRQATRLPLILLLLFGLSACSASEPPPPAPPAAPTFTAAVAPTLTPVPPPTSTPTVTPLGCLSAPGKLVKGEVATAERPIAYIVYLPPCYDEFPDRRYPVLYLLHGQTFTADQWTRIGAPEAADALIHSGQAAPFIMVFPEDRYWNIQQGLRFGQYLLNNVLPYIDANFRVLPDRSHRAIGGLSRGAGWAFEIGFTQPEQFGALGLHSLAVLSSDRAAYARWFREMPPGLWPRVYMDMGDNDRERDFNLQVERLLTQLGVPHEWRLNNGAHDEAYWSAHVSEYLRWYAAGWDQP